MPVFSFLGYIYDLKIMDDSRRRGQAIVLHSRGACGACGACGASARSRYRCGILE